VRVNTAERRESNGVLHEKMRVDNPRANHTVTLPVFMSTTEEKPQSLVPENYPFTAPQMMSRYVTDTGKILPRKYTHLSARQQRTITRTLKHARNLLLAP
jgi:small subunit ribosomal protein S18